MAEYTASCFTITMLPTNPTGIVHPEAHGFIVGKVRQTRVRIALDNAASAVTYPAGGAPLPSWNATTRGTNGDPSYGMRRNLSHLIPIGEEHASVSRANDVLWKFAPSGAGPGSMRAYQSQQPTTFPAAAGATELKEVPTTWSATLLTDKTPSWEFVAVGW